MIPLQNFQRLAGPRAAIAFGAGLALWLSLLLAPVMSRAAEPQAAPQSYAVHGQMTFEDQATLAFHSPYRGANSLDPAPRGRETFDATAFVGVRLWRGAEAWITPEVDQGFGLSNTLGLAGFSSGEAYKVGKRAPYVRLQRAFLRQTIDLSGDPVAVDADPMHLRGRQATNRLIITVGKFSVGDVFDTNDYAHDPRGDFMNWSLIDAGNFDYAADAWGYSTGGAVEWWQGRWTGRVGGFNLSVVPNNEVLEKSLGQFQMLGEIEERHRLRGRPGSVKITGFVSRGRMALFDDAVSAGAVTLSNPDVSRVRHYRSRAGISINLQQLLSDSLGVFARAGVSDGRYESYEFTDIDRTVSVGLSLNGAAWGRKADTVGIGAVMNGISAAHRRYLAAGGLGILVGDGQLPHPGPEDIVETYYSFAPIGPARIALDYQFVNNPAYNRDRGPVSIIAARLHAQF